MWTGIHDARKHVTEFRNNIKCQVLEIQDTSSQACIYREYIPTTIETRKDEVLGLLFHKEKLMCVIFYSL